MAAPTKAEMGRSERASIRSVDSFLANKIVLLESESTARRLDMFMASLDEDER